MKKLIFGLILTSLTPFVNANVQEFTYQSATKSVSVVIDQINSQFAFVKKIIFVSPTGCTTSIDGGMLKGGLNTKVSINFASFGWPLNDGNIEGMIANAIAIYPSSVSWPQIEAGACNISQSNGPVEIKLVSTQDNVTN